MGKTNGDAVRVLKCRPRCIFIVFGALFRLEMNLAVLASPVCCCSCCFILLRVLLDFHCFKCQFRVLILMFDR